MHELTLETYLKDLGFYNTSYGNDLNPSIGIISDRNDENRIQLFIAEDDPIDRDFESMMKYCLVAYSSDSEPTTIIESEMALDIWNTCKKLELGIYKL
tara:strand:- start:5109 stop:5402 length:294 start_codon:yes stop_codon:yes gene_type:complete